MQDFEVSKIWEKAAMHIHRAFADHLSSCDSIFLQLVDQNYVSPHLFHIPKILLLCHSPAFLFPSIALLKMFQKKVPRQLQQSHGWDLLYSFTSLILNLLLHLLKRDSCSPL